MSTLMILSSTKRSFRISILPALPIMQYFFNNKIFFFFPRLSSKSNFFYCYLSHSDGKICASRARNIERIGIFYIINNLSRGESERDESNQQDTLYIYFMEQRDFPARFRKHCIYYMIVRQEK